MLSKWSLALLGLVALAGSAAACDGLSPGDAFNDCTLGFLVASPDGLFFSTAGHCIDVDEPATTRDGSEFGVGAFHFLEPETGAQNDGSPGFDFALIRIHADAYPRLNPKICGWDGPTGVYDETPGSGGVRHYGHGTLVGEVSPRREGVALLNDGEAFYFYGAGVPGDSGSAVIAEDGRALGVLTHLQISPAGTNGGTHLDRGFRLAAEAGFVGLRLVLAGEDPLAVLASLRAPPPASETPAQPSPAPPSTPSSRPSPAPTRPTPEPTPQAEPTPPANDSIAPAATADDPARDTPGPALGLLLVGFALAAAWSRRKG